MILVEVILVDWLEMSAITFRKYFRWPPALLFGPTVFLSCFDIFPTETESSGGIYWRQQTYKNTICHFHSLFSGVCCLSLPCNWETNEKYGSKLTLSDLFVKYHLSVNTLKQRVIICPPVDCFYIPCIHKQLPTLKIVNTAVFLKGVKDICFIAYVFTTFKCSIFIFGESQLQLS